MSNEDKVVVSGFGTTSVNGTYICAEENFNGYQFYQKDANHILAYYIKLGPYSFSGAYYLIKLYQIEGSIPRWVPLYRLAGTSPSGSALWQYLVPQTSGQTATGTSVFNEGSSSSSSSSNSSSSSSSSIDSSSSSSSISSNSSSSNSSSSSSSHH